MTSFDLLLGEWDKSILGPLRVAGTGYIRMVTFL